MSLRTVTLSPPVTVVHTEKDMSGAIVRDVDGQVSIHAEWFEPQPDGSLPLVAKPASAAFVTAWMSKPGFAAFLDELRDDTEAT